jgi:hypothetical protein
MDTRRFGVATLVGGIALFAVGYLIFSVMFASFYAANIGSATGGDRTSQIQWVGAIVGFLIWCTTDFILYGATNIATLARTSVDPLLEIVHGGIAGAAVAAVAYRSRAVAKAVA